MMLDKYSMINKFLVSFLAINDLVLALQICWNSGNATFVESFVNQEVLCIFIDQQSIGMQLESIRKVITDVLFYK